MENEKITYPSNEDIKRISNYYDFKKFEIVKVDFKETNEIYELDAKFKFLFTTDSLKMDLLNKISAIYRNFIYVMYYFEKGVPDDEYLKSPGRDGQSISYYPNFNEKNFIDKASFNFFTDFFYFKLFSAWDSLCHVINLLYQLTINTKEISFNYKFIEKLKNKNENLSESLVAILNNEDFDKAKKIRNNITHNFSPNNIGTQIEENIEGNKIIGKIKHNKYYTSIEIKENISRSLDLLYKTLELFFEKPQTKEE